MFDRALSVLVGAALTAACSSAVPKGSAAHGEWLEKITTDFGENVSFEGGFAMHQRAHFQALIGNKGIAAGGNDAELYFVVPHRPNKRKRGERFRSHTPPASSAPHPAKALPPHLLHRTRSARPRCEQDWRRVS